MVHYSFLPKVQRYLETRQYICHFIFARKERDHYLLFQCCGLCHADPCLAYALHRRDVDRSGLLLASLLTVHRDGLFLSGVLATFISLYYSLKISVQVDTGLFL